MADSRWPQSLDFTKEIDAKKLVSELGEKIEPEPDDLGNLQAGFRIDAREGEDFTVSFRDDVTPALVKQIVKDHDPTPPPDPGPEPRPIEVLNEGIQAAQNMADVKKVFADFAERFGDRL